MDPKRQKTKKPRSSSARKPENPPRSPSSSSSASSMDRSSSSLSASPMDSKNPRSSSSSSSSKMDPNKPADSLSALVLGISTESQKFSKDAKMKQKEKEQPKAKDAKMKQKEKEQLKAKYAEDTKMKQKEEAKDAKMKQKEKEQLKEKEKQEAAFRDNLSDIDKVRYDVLKSFKGKYMHLATSFYKADESGMRRMLQKFGFPWKNFFLKFPRNKRPPITEEELKKFAMRPMYELHAYFKASETTIRKTAKELGVALQSVLPSLAELNPADDHLEVSTTLKTKQKDQENVNSADDHRVSASLKRKHDDGMLVFNVDSPDGMSEFLLELEDASFYAVQSRVADVLDLAVGGFSLEYRKPNGKFYLLKKQVHMEACLLTSLKNGEIELTVKKEP